MMNVNNIDVVQKFPQVAHPYGYSHCLRESADDYVERIQ